MCHPIATSAVLHRRHLCRAAQRGASAALALGSRRSRPPSHRGRSRRPSPPPLQGSQRSSTDRGKSLRSLFYRDHYRPPLDILPNIAYKDGYLSVGESYISQHWSRSPLFHTGPNKIILQHGKCDSARPGPQTITVVLYPEATRSLIRNQPRQPPSVPPSVSQHYSLHRPCAALPAARVSQLVIPLLPLVYSRRRPYPSLRLRLPAIDVAASSPPEALEAGAEGEEKGETRRKLYVANLPWTFPAEDIEKLFATCGLVKDVEVIKMKDGRRRGFAFVTMASAEEAAAAVQTLNSHDVMGRVIKVEYSKSFRKPAPPPAPDTTLERHKLYVSNLPWKARSTDLKEFFSKFNPISANVVFDNKKSAGYGFVSFGTKEEAEAALSELDGKELMGRPVLLKWRDDTEGVKAGGEIEGINLKDQVEGVMVDNGPEDEGKYKQG